MVRVDQLRESVFPIFKDVEAFNDPNFLDRRMTNAFDILHNCGAFAYVLGNYSLSSLNGRVSLASQNCESFIHTSNTIINSCVWTMATIQAVDVINHLSYKASKALGYSRYLSLPKSPFVLLTSYAYFSTANAFQPKIHPIEDFFP